MPFADYEIIEEAGAGAMGVVYRARQKSPDRILALKVMRSTGPEASSLRARFLNEARLASALRHPNIVTVHEVGTCPNGSPFFTMDFIDGESLKSLLARGPLTFGRIVEIMIAIAKGVGEAHRQGIIHRDLKPANILIDKAGNPYVADFGLAREIAAPTVFTATGTLIGTPQYMAPEQAQGRTKEIDRRTDVWALGAILYEMLTGRPPFPGQSTVDVLLDIIQRPLVPASALNVTVPRSLEVVCHRALEKDPVRRPTDAQAFASELEGCRLDPHAIRNAGFVSADPRAYHLPVEMVRGCAIRGSVPDWIGGLVVSSIASLVCAMGILIGVKYYLIPSLPENVAWYILLVTWAVTCMAYVWTFYSRKRNYFNRAELVTGTFLGGRWLKKLFTPLHVNIEYTYRGVIYRTGQVYFILPASFSWKVIPEGIAEVVVAVDPQEPSNGLLVCPGSAREVALGLGPRPWSSIGVPSLGEWLASTSPTMIILAALGYSALGSIVAMLKSRDQVGDWIFIAVCSGPAAILIGVATWKLIRRDRKGLPWPRGAVSLTVAEMNRGCPSMPVDWPKPEGRPGPTQIGSAPLTLIKRRSR